MESFKERNHNDIISSRIIDNIGSEVVHDTQYQNDELLQLEVVLQVNLDLIHDSLVDIDGRGRRNRYAITK